jgi:hypothetical protein
LFALFGVTKRFDFFSFRRFVRHSVSLPLHSLFLLVRQIILLPFECLYRLAWQIVPLHPLSGRVSWSDKNVLSPFLLLGSEKSFSLFSLYMSPGLIDRLTPLIKAFIAWPNKMF